MPNSVSAQLGNRVQHALRAFTPQEQKAIKAAAETFRQNPEIDTERAIMELKVGEALVSTLENKGEPSMVQRTLIRPPEGRVGPVSEEERLSVIEYSPVFDKYEEAIDRESAHEILTKRTDARDGPYRRRLGRRDFWRRRQRRRGETGVRAGNGRNDRQGIAEVHCTYGSVDDQEHNREIDYWPQSLSGAENLVASRFSPECQSALSSSA